MTKPRNLRRTPIVSKVEAREWELSPATGIEATDHGFTADERNEITKHCRKADLPLRKVHSLLRRLMTDYLVEREFDAFSATAGEVRDFAAGVQQAVGEVQSLLRPATLTNQVCVHRMGVPFLIEDLDALLSKFAERARSLPDLVAEPRQGGGRELAAGRQVALAARMLDAFEARGWPTGRGSLPILLLPICLASVGENTATPDRILRKARGQMRTVKSGI